MIGFVHTSNTFSLSAIQALQQQAESTYIGDTSFTPLPLPLVGDEIDITDQTFMQDNYGLDALYADGTTEDSTRLEAIALNTNITNWYVPSGTTIRINYVSIPAHVTAFYGGGTVKEAVKDVEYPYGPIVQRDNHTGFVIDGLTFIGDGVKYAQNKGEYGFIMFNNNHDAWDCEVRNCTLDGTDNSFRNGITMYGDSVLGSCKRLRIYNNETLAISRAGIEVLHRSDVVDVDSLAFEGMKIYNNYMDGTGFCGISFSQPRSNIEVYNNDIHGFNWALELNQCKNVDYHHNQSTDIQEEHVSNGGVGLHTPEYDDSNDANINWVHHNHMDNDDSRIHIYSGSHVDFYENFIRAMIQPEERSGHANFGNIYNNTIVKESSGYVHIGIYSISARAIFCSDGSFANEDGSIYNNDIYFTGTHIRDAVSIADSTASLSVTDNEIYCGSTQNCISTGNTATISGNTCTQSYTGTVPSSRTGAGLSDPANIGPQ